MHATLQRGPFLHSYSFTFLRLFSEDHRPPSGRPSTPLSPFFLFFFFRFRDLTPPPLASNSAQIERAKTIRSQASLHLAQEGKSKAEVASLLKHGVGASVGLMETKGYESYKREGERNAAIRA